MTWVQTHSGRAVDLLSPTEQQIDLADVVHSLARLTRFTGHTARPYTVAEHSVYCYRIAYSATRGVDPAGCLWALLHDAHEAYVGDISTPMKQALGKEARALLGLMTSRFDQLIAAAVGLSYSEVLEAEALVKRCDLLALAGERKWLLGERCERRWDLDFELGSMPKPQWRPPPSGSNAEDIQRLFMRTLKQALQRYSERKKAA